MSRGFVVTTPTREYLCTTREAAEKIGGAVREVELDEQMKRWREADGQWQSVWQFVE